MLTLSATLAGAREFSTNSTAPAWPSSTYSRWPAASNAPVAVGGFSALSNHQVFAAIKTNGLPLAGYSANGYVYTILTPYWWSPSWGAWGFDEYAITGPVGVPPNAASNSVLATNSFLAIHALHIPVAVTAAWDSVYGESTYVGDATLESFTNTMDPVSVPSMRMRIDSWRAYECQLAMERREAALGNTAPAGTLAASELMILDAGYPKYLSGVGGVGVSGLASANVAKVKAWLKANCGSFRDPRQPIAGAAAVPMMTETALCAIAAAPYNFFSNTPASDLWGGGHGIGHLYTSRWVLATNSINLRVTDWGGQPHYITGAAGSVVTQLCTNAWIAVGYTHNDYGWRPIPAMFSALTSTVLTASSVLLWQSNRNGSSVSDWPEAKGVAISDTDGIRVRPPEWGAEMVNDMSYGNQGKFDGLWWDAAIHNSTVRLYTAASLWTGYSKTVCFYAAGTNLEQNSDYTFDRNGQPILFGVFTNVGAAVAAGNSASATCGATIGSSADPTWCDEPTLGGPTTGRGFELWKAKAVVNWNFN